MNVVRDGWSRLIQNSARCAAVLVRVLLFVILLRLLLPAPILITTGPPQTVHSEHPITGVHTRLTDEVEEWKIKRSLELVREMGAPWIVEFFPWAYYQGSDGDIAWQHPDQVVNHAHAQGLTIIARMGLTPDWARPADTPLTYLDDEAYDDFAAFAAAFASRYQGKVDYLIIGNEPNLSYEWGYRPATAEDYVNLLEVVYPAVKEANPDMQILAGALARQFMTAEAIDPDGDTVIEEDECPGDPDQDGWPSTHDPDSDNDGLSDGGEVNQHNTDPLTDDSGGDRGQQEPFRQRGPDPIDLGHVVDR